MDSITHTLIGAVIAKAIHDDKVGNWGTIAGLAMGFFPDSDFVLGLFNRQFYIQYHRDFTHSLLLIPFYALFFSWVFMKISKRRHFWSFYKICLPVLVSHLLLDLLTSYGTMVFSPLLNTRFAWDLIFIIDLIFSGIVFIPLLASFLWKKGADWICRGALIGLALYIFLNWVQQDRATRLANAFAESLNEKVTQVASLPQPLSPFRWANYVETEGRVYQGFVDLLKKGAGPPFVLGTGPNSDSPGFSESLRRLDSLYQSPETLQYKFWEKSKDSPCIARAQGTEGSRLFYWFARFPVVYSINSNHGGYRVEFIDLRFHMPGIRTPFRYYVDFDGSGGIQSEGFVKDQGKGDAGKDRPQTQN